jgi:hypothetical protein
VSTVEIQAAAAARTEITIETICTELDDAISVARSKGQANAMVSAASLRARLAGLMVEKVELGITHNYTKQGASPDEILQCFWHSCTINCPDIEITDEDREWLAAILKALRRLEDRMIGRAMQRVIEQDRQARILSDGQRLFSTGLFNERGRPHG